MTVLFGPIGAATLTIGSEQVSTTNYGTVGSAPQSRPRIGGMQRIGQTLTLDDSMLSGVTGRQWYLAGVPVSGATGTSYTPTVAAVVRCDVTYANGTISTPDFLIHMDHATSSHNTMDDAMLALVPHTDATHIAVTDGDWSNAATWDTGSVPGMGAVVLVPRNRTVIYDVATAVRLDRCRVDGVLKIALDQSTEMLVETLIVQRGGSFLQGDGAGARLPEVYSHTVTISGRDYRTSPNAASDINLATDPMLLGRGIISNGTWRAFAAFKDPFVWTADDSAPRAGDTSVILSQAATGWTVGDSIIIPGTAVDLDSNDTNFNYDEERVITSITTTNVANDTLHFSAALSYDHHHHYSATSRTDLQTPIIAKDRNIVIKSEETSPVYRRGHTMCMHGAAVMDLWGIRFDELGRTNKGKNQNVGIKSGNNFMDWTGATSTFTARSNIAARYPCHGHILGYQKPEVPLVRDCIVDGTPGWGYAHHDCEMDLHKNVTYRFSGTGMVAEQGSETGVWVENISCGLVSDDGSYGAPKGAIGNAGKQGDIGRNGYGFFYRGRAIRAVGNIAIACTWGHVFYHRHTASPTINTRLDTARVNVSYGDINIFDRDSVDTIEVNRYPITNFKDNIAIGCYTGLAVVKANSAQRHDIMSLWRGYKCWGCKRGMYIEYIGNYLLEGCDLVGSDFKPQGLKYPGNSSSHFGIGTAKDETIIFRNNKMEGFYSGFYLVGATLNATDIDGGVLNNGDFDGTDDPRYILINNDTSGCTVETRYSDEGSQPVSTQSVTKTYGSDPAPVPVSTDLPFVLGQISGTSVSGVARGLKTDSISAAQPAPKRWDGLSMVFGSATMDQGLRNYWQANGYHTYGGSNIVLVPYYFSDRTTGRPAKFMHAYQINDSVAGYTNLGTFTLSASPPVRADIATVASKGVAQTIDVLTAATGPGTMSFDGTYQPPDHGKIAFSGTDVIYTSDPDYTGDDEFYVFIYNGQGRYASVKVDVTVS